MQQSDTAVDISSDAVLNATRLRDDARLLLELGRNASAYYLSIVAVEEVGKFLLLEWNKMNGIPKIERKLDHHFSKQLAFSVLLLADVVIGRHLILADELGVDPEEVVLARAMKAMKFISENSTDKSSMKFNKDLHAALFNAKHRMFMGMTLGNLVQKAKHSALYSGTEGFSFWDPNDAAVTEGLHSALDDMNALLQADDGSYIRYARLIFVRMDDPEVKNVLEALREQPFRGV